MGVSGNDCEALIAAAGEHDAGAVKRLLAAGTSPNCKASQFGNSALYNAVYSDDLEIVEVLLAADADPNLRMNYESPVDGRKERGVVALMYARSEQVAAALITAGADVNIADAEMMTPLMFASDRGKPGIVKLLLENGADQYPKARSGKRAREFAEARLTDWGDVQKQTGNREIAIRIQAFEATIEVLDNAST